MSHVVLDRSKAARIATASQVALGVVVLAGITGTVVLGRGTIAAPKGPLALVDLPPLPSNQPGNANQVAVDNDGIAVRLGAIANAPQKPATPETPASETPTQPPPPAPEHTVEYLGQVGLGNAKLALIRHNTAQRIVGVDDVVGPYKVVEISHTKLGLDESGRRTDIDLKPKSADVVTRAASTPAGNPMMANGANAAATSAMRRAAEAARLARLNAAKSGAVKGAPSPRPNSPEGFEARYNAVMERLKTSGQFANEDDMAAAAKRLLEAEDGNK